MEVKEASVRYVRATGYKQTEVGVIPEDWNVVNFGDLVNYTKGYAFKSSEYVFDGVRVIRVSDTTYDSITSDGAVFVSEKSASKYSKWCLRENDLIFSTVGSKPPMYDSLVGKVILVPGDFSGSLLNQNAVLIRAKKFSGAFQKFLLNHFRTERYIRYIELIFRGNANQASITLVDLFNFRLPLPPTKAEQEAIAEALSDADALVESLEQLLTKKRHLKQGAMQQLLTGQKRLPGFSGEWEMKRLGDIAQADWGNTSITKDSYQDYGYAAYSASGQDGFVSWFEHEGAGVVISAIGDQCGKTWLAHGQWTPIKNTIWFKTDDSEASTEFLFWKTGDRDFWPKSGQAQPFVSVGSVRNAFVSLPPTITEQTAIATVLSDMDAELAALETKLAKARNLKQGMMQELLTGRIRLV